MLESAGPTDDVLHKFPLIKQFSLEGLGEDGATYMRAALTLLRGALTDARHESTKVKGAVRGGVLSKPALIESITTSVHGSTD